MAEPEHNRKFTWEDDDIVIFSAPNSGSKELDALNAEIEKVGKHLMLSGISPAQRTKMVFDPPEEDATEL
jgi:hypothetical protein